MVDHECNNPYNQSARDTEILNVRDVQGDGNCLFRCVSVALYSDEDKHKDIRATVVETMKNNKDFYQAYTDNDIDEHIINVANSNGHTNTWGTEAEIFALCKAFNVDIFVRNEQQTHAGWQRFSQEEKCNHTREFIKILNSHNHYKLVTGNTRICKCDQAQQKRKKRSVLKPLYEENKNEEETPAETQVEISTVNMSGQREARQENQWTNSEGTQKVIEEIYNRIIFYKHHNIFTPTQGRSTEMMMEEMTRIITEYNADTSGSKMALKKLMIMPKLLLQKEHTKAKQKENDHALKRRIVLWRQERYEELMHEAEAIQKRILKHPRLKTQEDVPRKFRHKMEEGNVRQAARLLQPHCEEGLLPINDDTIEKLKQKHPTKKGASQEALLTGEIEVPHEVTFRSITSEMVRKVATETKGAPGPSGMDASTWRMQHQEGMPQPLMTFAKQWQN